MQGQSSTNHAKATAPIRGPCPASLVPPVSSWPSSQFPASVYSSPPSVSLRDHPLVSTSSCRQVPPRSPHRNPLSLDLEFRVGSSPRLIVAWCSFCSVRLTLLTCSSIACAVPAIALFMYSNKSLPCWWYAFSMLASPEANNVLASSDRLQAPAGAPAAPSAEAAPRGERERSS